MSAVIRASHIEGNIGTGFHAVRSDELRLCLEALAFTDLFTAPSVFSLQLGFNIYVQ